MSDSLWPHGLYSPWKSPGQNTGVGSLSLLQGIKPRSPTLQADSLPSEPPGKPKNTGVGSLSLLQWIFPTQESNQGHRHCKQILSQLSYQESPYLFCYFSPLKVKRLSYRTEIWDFFLSWFFFFISKLFWNHKYSLSFVDFMKIYTHFSYFSFDEIVMLYRVNDNIWLAALFPF